MLLAAPLHVAQLELHAEQMLLDVSLNWLVSQVGEQVLKVVRNRMPEHERQSVVAPSMHVVQEVSQL